VSSESGELLDRDRIRELLAELGRRCASHGFTVEMFIVGGSAIALAYGERRSTRDVDAVFEPKMEVYVEARKMADEFGLPEDWLNDGVKGLLPDFPDTGKQTTEMSEGIHVIVPSAEYLFAMKATSARLEIDDDDLELLGCAIGIASAEDAFRVVEKFYRADRISAKTGFFIESIYPDKVE
jgi:hypothetical protein